MHAGRRRTTPMDQTSRRRRERERERSRDLAEGIDRWLALMATAVQLLRLLVALFSSQKILQNFSDSLSHRIFRHMHEVLNIDKNKN